MSDQGSFEGRTSEILCEFLEAAVHTALRVKGVYPPEVFERRRLYNVAVSRSRHPGLNAYVKETIFSLKPWIKQGKLERLAVLFFEEEGDALVERLVFSVKVLKEVEGSFESLDDLEHMLRAFVLKIQVAEPLASRCRFELLAYSWSREEGERDPVWVMEDAGGDRVSLRDPCITPIKSISSDCLKIQLYSEAPRARAAE